MKKLLFFLMTLMALSLAWGGAVKAQETLTVYDQGGDNNNYYVPMYGGYFDENTKTEFVIPAAKLEAMNGGTITSMKFYISSVSGTYSWASTQTVFLKEVESDQLSAYSGTDGATVVYTGQFTAPEATETEFEITFQTPYEYHGGNLLVGIYNSAGGSNHYRFVYWYGENVNGASGSGSSSSSMAYVSFSQKNFIPMTTFTYTPGTPSTCEKPATLEHSSVTTAGATLTWTGGSGTYNLEEKGGSYTDWTSVLSNTSLTTTTLTPLDPETQYQVRVQSVCGEEVSGWKTSSFTTPCGTITTFPKTYTFETSDGFPSNASTPTTNPFSSCWRNEATVQNGSYSTRVWGTSTSYNKNGSQSLVLPDKGNNTNPAKTMLVFPAMDFTSANGYVVSFWIYRNTSGSSSSPEGFKVYASDCDTIGTNAVDLGFYSIYYNIAYPQIESTSGWYYYETAPITMTGTVYIIFEGQSYYQSATYVDDVTIKVAPSCFKPTGLEANNVTTHSADLSWTVNSGETAWTIYYKKTSDENYTEVSNVTENPYTLPALDDATNYQFYVVANCSATDNSEASDVKIFTTECEAISAVGYSANFDDYTAGNNVLPLCWRPINTTTNSSYTGYPKIYNYSANSPSNCLYLYSYAYYSAGITTYDPQPQYAILPEMTDLTGKRITLQARGYNTSSTFKVGTMSDPTDASTFTEITSSPDNPAAMTTSYQKYIFDIANTTDRYVAIMIEAANSTRTSNGAYIDDIVFSLSPTCFAPTEAHADVQDANNVTISWTPDARNTDGGSYSILDADQNVVAGAENITGTSFPLIGLTPETSYTYYVHTNCFNTAENVEDVIVSFTTPANCAAPILAADAITDITAHNATVTWTGFTSNNEYAVRYRTAAYFYGLSEAFNGTSIPTGWTRYSGLVDDVIAGTATLSTFSGGWNMVTAASNVFSSNHIKLNIFGESVKSWLVTPEFNLPANTTMSFDLAQTAYASNGNSTSAASGARDDDRLVVLITTDNGATWEILREWNNSGSSYVFNDISETPENVNISLNSYSGHVKVAFYGESTIKGNGDNDMHIDNISMGYSVPVGDWQTVTPNPTTTSTTLTGLTAETSYEVKVNGVCNGSEEETGSDIRSFTTTIACPTPTNLECSNVTAHTANLTWNVNGNPTTNYVLTKNGEESNIVVTINEGVASYQLQNLNGETEYTVSVKANCGNLDGYSTLSNEKTFTTLVSCAIPTELAAIDETTSSIKLHWTANNGETAWVVAHKIDGADDFTEVTVAQSDLDGDGNFNLTGLSDGKTYTIKVRANCGVTDGLSQWSSTITHATAASCATPTDLTVSDVNGHGATISWTDVTVEGKNYIVMVASENMALNVDFENNSIPSNFTNDANYPWYVYTGTDCTSKAMRSGNYNISSSTSAIEVTVNVTEASTLSFDFWSRGEGTDNNDWDNGRFYIDGTMKFRYGKHDSWESYSTPIEAGNHTLKWEYKKDGVTDEEGDCFYVDNIKITAGASAFVEKDPTTATSLELNDLDPETTYYVKVKGDCGSATSPESGVETFTTPAACNAPTSLTYDDESVTAHTVDLSWTENNGATAWKVIYSKVNIDNSEITVDIDENDVTTDGTTITYTLGGLDGQTAYIAHVKSNCGGVHNDISAESNSTSFTTLTACYPVGDVITSDITAYTVTVHWSDYYNAGAYIVKQGDNVLDGTTTPSVVIDATNHTATISGLEPEHTYTYGTFTVFADCGTEGMSTGTKVPYFQTEPSCHPVTNVNITGKTANSVTFTWEDTHTPETYIIKEGEEVLSDVTTHSVVIDATNNTATINGLDEKATYTAGTFKVFADCGTTDGQSAGVNVPAFTTPCSANTIFPWTETFNDLTTANTIPDCWNNDEGTTSNASYKWCYTTATSGNGACNGTSHDGSKCVRFNSYYGSHINYLKSIPLSLPTDQTMQLKFWYKNPTGGDFSVYISTDGGATHETALATGLTGVSDWTEHDPINLSAYVGQEVVLVFKGTSNNGNDNAYIYLDDVTVEEAPACAAPTALGATAISNYSATLSWTANSGETEWTLYYKKTSDENYTEVTENVTNPYALAVDPATEYIYYVVANCSATTTSNPSSTYTFTTKCDPFVVHRNQSFTENFDATTFPPTSCWNTIPSGTYDWSRDGTSGKNHSGSIYGSAYSYYYGDVYLVLPDIALTDDATDVKLTFWSYNTYVGSYGKNSVVLLDGDNETELWSPTSVSQSWKCDTVNLSAYKGQTISLAFKYEGSNAHGWYLDDIAVAFDPCYPVTNLSYDNESLTANTVALSWTPGAETNWRLQYRENGTQDWNTVDVAETDLINGVYTLDQLNAGATYEWQVAAACTNTFISDYTAGANFTTLENCPAPTNLTLTTDSETPNGATITWTAGSTANEHFTVEYRVVNEETWIEIPSYIEETTYTFTTLEPATTYQARVGAVCGTYLSDYSNVVNFTTEPAPCPVPTGLYTVEVGSDTATVRWGSQESAWNLQYRVQGENDWIPANTQAQGDSIYTFTGLTENTTYEWQVQANCGNNNLSEWADAATFKTLCAPVATYSENFDNMTAGVMPDCWTKVGANHAQVAGGETTAYPYSGHYCFYIYNGINDNRTSIVLTPPLSVEINTMQINLFVTPAGGYGDGYGNLYVGYMTDASDATSFVPVKTLKATEITDWKQVIVPMTTAPAGAVMALKVVAGGGSTNVEKGWYIDDVVIEPAVCPVPTGLYTAAVGADTAKVRWVAGGEETAWNLKYHAQGDNDWAEATAQGDSTFTFTQLTANTTYEWQVQAVCGTNFMSEWSALGTFTTKQCNDADQCQINYELTDAYGNDWEGAAINVMDAQTNAVITTITRTGSEIVNGSFNVCDGQEIQFNWVAGDNNGYRDSECGYTFTDRNGNLILAGDGALTAAVNHTVSCAVAPLCAAPTGLNTVSLTADGAIVQWVAGGDETAWNLQYRANTENAWTTVSNLTENTHTFTGLTEGTFYFWRVQANCGTSSSVWSVKGDFTPEQPAVPVVCEDTLLLTSVNDLAVGDVVFLVYEGDDNYELSGIATNNIGTGVTYSNKPAGLYPLNVAEGSEDGSFAFENNGNYLAWNSGNNLTTSTTVSDNSSWTVTIANDGTATIANVGTMSRKIQWNSGSPRFACYAGTQKAVSLYKVTYLKAQSDTTAVELAESFEWRGHTYTASGEYEVTVGTAASGCDSVRVLHLTLQKKVAKPTFNPAAGEYTEPQTVAIACTTEGATIYYTLDGTYPTPNSNLYEQPFELTQTTTVNAIAIKQGEEWVDSDTATAIYTINIPVYTVTLNPGNGTVNGQTQYEGNVLNPVDLANATATANVACGNDWTFAGWSTTNVTETQTAPTFVTTFTPDQNTTLYAVYKKVTATNKDTAVNFSAGSYSNSVITWTLQNVITIKQEPNGAQTSPNSSYVSSPRWYKGNKITITPAVNVDSLTIITTTTGYASALESSTYTNASVSVSDTKVVIKPSTGTSPVTIVMYAQARPSSLVVSYTGGSTTYNSNPECVVLYAVNVDGNVQNGTIEADATEAAEGTTVNLTANPATGYHLGEWSVTKTNTPTVETVAVTNNSFEMPASDVNVSATFVPDTFTVTFVLNGAAYVPGYTPINRYWYKQSPEPALPTAQDMVYEGHSFGGWYENANLEGNIWTSIFTDTAKSNLTYYAKWTANEYTITYMDGNTELHKDTLIFGAPVTAYSNTDNPGYLFKGWDGEIPTTMPAEDLTFNAIYEPDTFTVTFVLNGAAYVPGYTPINRYWYKQSPEPALPTAQDMVYEGHSFGGWYENANLEGNIWTSIYTDTAKSNLTYYAKWTANEYTITYMDGNTELHKDTLAYGAPVTAYSNTDKPGYIFKGWDGEIPTTMPAEDLTFNAIYVPDTFTVTFVLNGAAYVPGYTPINRYWYKQSPEPALPTAQDMVYEGHSFGGWYENANLEGNIWTSIYTDTAKSNLTYYAKWTANEYTITYMDGNTELHKDTLAYGAPVTAYSNTDNPGYIFKGWDGEIPTTMPAEDLTFNAIYEPDTFTVTFVLNGAAYVPGYTPINRYWYQQVPALPTAQDMEYEGHSFEGWYENANLQGNSWTSIPDTAKSNLTYYAKWTANEYDVNVLQAANGSIEVNPTSATMGTTINLTAIPATGYHFGQWRVSKSATAYDPVTVTNNAFVMPASDVYVNAIFWIDTLHITASANAQQGSVSPEELYVTYGEEVTLTATPNANFLFDNWTAGNETFSQNPLTFVATKDSAFVAHFADMGTVTTPVISSDPAGNNFTSEQTVTVTIECNTANATIYYTLDGTDPVVPARRNVTGTQVYTAPFTINSTTTVKAVAAAVDMINSDMATKSFRFVPMRYVNDWNTANGTVSYDPVKDTAGATITVSATPNEGYHFAQWHVFDFNGNDVTVTNNAFIMPDTNVYVDAIFEPDTFTVTFELNGGQFVNGYTPISRYWYQQQGANLPTAADMEYEGHSFDGWYENANLQGNSWTSVPDTAKSNKTYYAKWNVNSYDLTINYVDGNNQTLAPAHTETLDYNIEYNVTTPAVDTYMPDQAVVSGTMGAAAVTVTVTYTQIVMNAVDNQTLCVDGTTDAVEFSLPATLTQTFPGMEVMFEKVIDNTSIGIADEQYGNIAAFTALNAGTEPVVSTITVTPLCTLNSHAVRGVPQTFTITVNPKSVSEFSEIACDSYTWTAADTTIVDEGENDYVHVFQNQYGCDSTVTLHLNLHKTPIAAASVAQDYYCTDQSITLDSTGSSKGADGEFTYAWTGPNGYASTEAKPTIANPLTADMSGTYTLVVTHVATGCASEPATVDVVVNTPGTPGYLFTITTHGDAYANFDGGLDVVTPVFAAPEVNHFLSAYFNSGDITVANDAQPTYNAVGDYTINWTATDPCGNVATTTQVLHVTQNTCPVATDVDNNTYPSVSLAGKCWMAKNLRTTKYSDGRAVNNLMVYENAMYPNATENLDRYGYLYDWNAAMDAENGVTLDADNNVKGICPDGWHLPNGEDFMNVAGTSTATDMFDLRYNNYWLDGGGNNSTNFSLLPGGCYNENAGRYENLLGNAYLWGVNSSNPAQPRVYWADCKCYMWQVNDVTEGMGYSVRCIKD